MGYRIFWTPVAVQDLRGIWDFISQDNPAAAERVGQELIHEAEAVGLFPRSGRMVPEKKDPLIRETIVGSYRVIYQIDDSSRVVAIVRIWHSARGAPEL